MSDDVLSFEIIGLKEVTERLASIGEKVAKKALKKAIQAGVDVMGHEIQSRTPVDTGLLKINVGTTVKVAPDKQAGLGAVGFGREDHLARWIEFGHRIVGHKPGKKDTGKHVPARPFIRPGFDASKEKAVEAFTEVMSEELDKAAKGS